ncbi:serine/arginine repetitive matrix protein 1 [Metarhizium rileyi]|uniref:Serine/arginine repetitive matrix protein 1 n=1 Tax=Metarhizium rileyi (strain RCEF 4871) TaxID=1649241 RepID=A0A167ESB8_METRR|nr:serine/arginine repetitive matrix protein 1 [Metarhizium rileyi RCEF 4871]
MDRNRPRDSPAGFHLESLAVRAIEKVAMPIVLDFYMMTARLSDMVQKSHERSATKSTSEKSTSEKSTTTESATTESTSEKSTSEKSTSEKSTSEKSTPKKSHHRRLRQLRARTISASATIKKCPSRRGSPVRDNRYDRPRSPRRDWERERDRDWDRDRMRDRERDFDRRDERQRSRSPFGRDRRARSPPVKAAPVGARGGSYRPRSRSQSRIGERYQTYRRASPIRESGVSSAITSQPPSERASPRPGSIRTRSPLQSREQSPHRTTGSGSGSVRDTPRSGPYEPPSASRSPPRGPAALRAPPTGPSANRTLSTSVSSPLPSSSRHPQTPAAGPHRTDAPSPTNPPSGPRGYVAQRGGYSSRAGRGGWSQPPSRQMSGLSPSPTTPGGSASIPTGPRGAPSAGSSTPTQGGRPFNPPTGPASQHGNGPRQSLAQSLLATMPPLIPGGKLDPSMTPLTLGVTRELESHYRKLRDEEEKVRDELRVRQERLRKSLYMWDRLERESRSWELRSDLSEKSMKNLAGEGMGGAAF